MNVETKFLSTEYWHPPVEVYVEGDALVWSPEQNYRRPLLPREGLLEEFVRLGDEPAENIARYARRWGVLKICACHLPYTHNPVRPWNRMGPMVTWCNPLGFHEGRRSDGQWWEPIDAWRRWSRQARSILKIIGTLRDGCLPDKDDWQVVYSHSGAPRQAPWWKRRDGVEFERQKIAEIVNEWLILGDVRPVLHWETWQSKPAVVKMNQPGLFPAIAYQLALALSTRRAVSICSGCGFGYFPKKASSPGRRSFCEDCCDMGVHQKLALKDLRARKARAKELYQRGFEPSEIVKKVGSRESTIRRWIAKWPKPVRGKK